MDSRRVSESFITAVNVKNREQNNSNNKPIDYLSDVRVEHAKLQGVVAAFGKKVESTIEKQRKEFMEAYDMHMAGIQRELLILRNKVISIDKNFREEKLKRIRAEEEKYRNESLRLDQIVLIETEKLKYSSGTMRTLQDEVEWLFKKLEKEKKKYQRLSSIKKDTFGQDSLFSVDSSTSRVMQFQLIETNKKKKQIQTEPSGYKFPSNDWPTPLKSASTLLENSLLQQQQRQTQQMDPMNTATTGINTTNGRNLNINSLRANSQQRVKFSSIKNKQNSLLYEEEKQKHDSKRALRELVSKRSLQSESVDFLHQCELNSELERQTALSEVDANSEIHRLLVDIKQLPYSFEMNTTVNRQRRTELIQQLLAYPQLYDLIGKAIIECRLWSDEDFFESEMPQEGAVGVDSTPVTGGHIVDEDILRYLTASSRQSKR